MKDIKSMMIGFLLATCMFLMMGQGSNDSQVGRYQGFAAGGTRFMIDTTNGELWGSKITRIKMPNWKKAIDANSFEE